MEYTLSPVKAYTTPEEVLAAWERDERFLIEGPEVPGETRKSLFQRLGDEGEVKVRLEFGEGRTKAVTFKMTLFKYEEVGAKDWRNLPKWICQKYECGAARYSADPAPTCPKCYRAMGRKRPVKPKKKPAGPSLKDLLPVGTVATREE
jgi:hypothetical protein